MGVDSLDGNTNLSRVVESTFGKKRDGCVKVGVGRDDDGRRAAVFQRTTRAGR